MTLPLKHLFDLPEGVIYLDGNSLGPLPKGAEARAVRTMTDEWGNGLIRAWNAAGWMALPQRVGDRIGGLIGAVIDRLRAGTDASRTDIM